MAGSLYWRRPRCEAHDSCDCTESMTRSDYSDVRKLYKFAIAYDSFTERSKTCEQLITAGTQSAAPGYYIIAAGIVTTYARPFTDNALIGMISPSLVPSEFKWLHKTLIELRNKRSKTGRKLPSVRWSANREQSWLISAFHIVSRKARHANLQYNLK